MNLGTPGKPVEITKENVLDQIIAAAAILDEAAESRPWYIQLPQPARDWPHRHSRLDKRQMRRFHRSQGRKRGVIVAGYFTGNKS